jgi:hypothetical protein
MRRTLKLVLTALLVAAVGSTTSSGSPAAAATADYIVAVPAGSFAYSPGSGARSPWTVLLYSTGSAWAFVTTTSVTRRLAFHVVSDQCEGAPVLGVAVDGVTAMTRETYGVGDYGIVGTWGPGRHQVVFRFLNDHRTDACDRNIRVSQVSLFAHADGSVHGVSSRQQAQQKYAVLPPESGDSLDDGQVHVAGDGTVALRLDSQGARQLYLSLIPAGCDPWAELQVSVDGVTYQAGRIPPTLGSIGVGTISVQHAFTNGTHDIDLRFSDVWPRPNGCVPTVDLITLQFQGWV